MNVCFAEAIQTFSEKKQLDEHGNEQEVGRTLVRVFNNGRLLMEARRESISL